MDGLKNIEIKNFRGIDSLKIDDFSRVNVFLGQNSSGKTTILECLMLLMGMSNADLPQNLNIIRSRTLSGFSDLIYMFHNLNYEQKPEIFSNMYDGTKRHLSLDLTYMFDENSQPELMSGQIISSETKKVFNTLKMSFDINGKKYESCSTFNEKGLVLKRKHAEDYLEKSKVVLMSADMTTDYLSSSLVELSISKKRDIVTERLKDFDSRITSLEILNNVAYVGLEGVSKLMTVSMMGDGLRRFLNIVATSANPSTNIVLIDEIDNGLHYSAYKKLWEAIFALATETNKQVFVTTHSKETLYKLNEMLEEHSEYQESLRLYTIANTPKKGHQAYKYTYEGLSSACENDVELRGRL